MLPMKLVLSLTFVLAALPVSQPKWFRTYAGPFKVIVRKVELCPANKRGPRDAVIQYKTIRGYHQLDRYNLNVSVPMVVDDSLTFRAEVASWSSTGGWKDNAHVFSVKKCCTEVFRHFKHLLIHLSNISFGEVLGCPFFPGLYRGVNMTYPEELLYSPLIKQFVYGKWRADSQLFMKNGDVAYCVRSFFDTVPK